QRANGGDEIGPNVQADENDSERFDQFSEAISHALGDDVHGWQKLAGRNKSLNRASTWRVRAETARAAHSRTPTPLHRPSPRPLRAATRSRRPAGRSARRRSGTNQDAPPGSLPA